MQKELFQDQMKKRLAAKEAAYYYGSSLPQCDFCKEERKENGRGRVLLARYDAMTEYGGPWAYMCKRHYANFGIGLGLGVGQELILKK